MSSATYAEAFAKDAGTTERPGVGCGTCQLKSVDEEWLPDQMINPPAEYKKDYSDCVRNTNGIAPLPCKRQYTYLRQCNQDLRVILIDGATSAPTAMPTARVDSETKKARSSVPVILGAICFIVACAALLAYSRKQRSSDSEKTVELSEYAPPTLKLTSTTIATTSKKLCPMQEEPIGPSPNELPVFEPDHQYPENDTAKLLCKNVWTSTSVASVVETKNNTSVIDYEYLRQRTDNFNAKYLIGDGASCKVYATTIYYGVEVAIKVLSSDSSEWEVQQFTSEVELLTKVKHDNICQVLRSIPVFAY
jgi:hypothetical protein